MLSSNVADLIDSAMHPDNHVSPEDVRESSSNLESVPSIVRHMSPAIYELFFMVIWTVHVTELHGRPVVRLLYVLRVKVRSMGGEATMRACSCPVSAQSSAQQTLRASSHWGLKRV